MKVSDQLLTGRHYQMSIVSINPQDNLLNSQKSHNDIDQNLQKFISHNDTESASESFMLKNQKLDNLNFLKRQSKKFKSLKCSIRKNPDKNQFPQEKYHNLTSSCKKSDVNVNQTFLRETLQKNSLMNKILSQQRKANNFNCLKNSLFQSLNHKQAFNSINLKDHSQVQNEKIIALLSQRPFQRKSSFGVPFRKLKMAKNLKQFQRKNTHLNQSSNYVNLKRKYSERRQNNETSLLTLEKLKKLSYDSLEKSTIKNDVHREILKKIQQSSSIQKRHSQLRNYQEKQKKKPLLTISDDQSQLKSSLGVSTQMIAKKKVRTEPTEDFQSKKQFFNENKVKKCQEKIMNDLVKLQKIRNQKIVSNRGHNQSKNTKTNGIKINHGKFMLSDRNQENSLKKSKYIIKFKTQPNQNPLQKLKTRINYQIKDDQFNQKMSIKNEFYKVNQVHGYAKTFQRKNSTQMCQLKSQKDKKIKLEAINHKIKYLEKQLSGWDISKQTDLKQNWNLNIF